jgi:hypothetical protein
MSNNLVHETNSRVAMHALICIKCGIWEQRDQPVGDLVQGWVTGRGDHSHPQAPMPGRVDQLMKPNWHPRLNLAKVTISFLSRHAKA